MVCVWAGCHHDGEENFGFSDGKAAIDVAALTRPAELLRALSLTGKPLDDRLGAHQMEARATLELIDPAETLAETFLVQSDGRGGLHVQHDNDHDYGFEAIGVANNLYVRPRYGKFVRHRVEAAERDRLRATGETAAAAYLRLLQRFVAVQVVGRVEQAGYAAMKLKLARAAAPAPRSPESEPGKKWRESVEAQDLDGEVVLDARSGAPLTVRLSASYRFERTGKPLLATLHFSQTTSAWSGTIAPPSEAVALVRPRPLLDRQTLLDGIGNYR
jgi:hypothetical protein